MTDLQSLFEPDRIAVVGATDQEGSIGQVLMQNLQESFEGDVIPVNPNYEEVVGTACVSDVAEAGDVDLAVLAVPVKIVLECLRDAGEAGVSNVVVITAGFREMGAKGKRREEELVNVAAEYDMNVVGPNCLGVVRTSNGLNATFAPGEIREGALSFVSQSGALVTAVLDWAYSRGFGFRDVVSVGNKPVVDEVDLIQMWGDDPDTAVILGYLEDVKDGREFVETVRDVSQDTPVVLLKAGRTEAGAKAASSHTGAIASSDAAYEAAFEQSGTIRVDTVTELFDSGEILDEQPLLDSPGVAVVSGAGGPSILTTDAISRSSLELTTFAEETRTALRDELPAEANPNNPLDIIGDTGIERFRRTLSIVLADPNVAGLVVPTVPAATMSNEELAGVIGELHAETGIPIVVCEMGGDLLDPARSVLDEYNIPTYFDPERAVNALEQLAVYEGIRTREYPAPASFDVDRDRVEDILASVPDQSDTVLGVDAMEVLDAYGIQTPERYIVDDGEAARDAARKIGQAVVLKIVSPDITHKTDVGGVSVGVAPERVPAAYDDMLQAVRQAKPDANIQGVQVEEMIDTETGVETIVGMKRDPSFGPLLMFGLGGIFVEVLEDTAFRVAPVSEREGRELIEDIDATPLLRGARGRAPIDEESLVEVIQRISQLVTDFPEFAELDINPLIASPDGTVAVDFRARVDTR